MDLNFCVRSILLLGWWGGGGGGGQKCEKQAHEHMQAVRLRAAFFHSKKERLMLNIYDVVQHSSG